MNDLPVIYNFSMNAWFAMKILKCFSNYFIPAVNRHQSDVLHILRESVYALLLLDNPLAHPNLKELVSDAGQIRCLFLPPNMTSLIQPMNQGIIMVVEKLCTGLFLKEVLCVTESEETRRQ